MKVDFFEQNWKIQAPKVGLSTEWYGKTFKYKGKTYQIIDIVLGKAYEVETWIVGGTVRDRVSFRSHVVKEIMEA